MTELFGCNRCGDLLESGEERDITIDERTFHLCTNCHTDLLKWVRAGDDEWMEEDHE